MALYGALKWQGPAGMALPASPTGDSPGGNRPSFPTNPPAEPGAAERWPIASTIRPVSLEVAGVSAWIAEAYGGGVCVLVSAQGTNGAVGFSCSTRQMLSRGTGLELPDLPASPGKVLKVGVVPNATRAMAVGLVGGRTATASVSDNAWAYLADDGSVVPGSTSPIGG